jgi:hypothetical protein
LTREGAARRINDLLQASQLREAEAALDSCAPAALIASSLSAEHAAFWLERSKNWAGAGAPSSFRRFRIELLMACRKRDEAAAALTEWIGQTDPPQDEWVLLRACQDDSLSFCSRILEAYAARALGPIPKRIQLLRESRGVGARESSLLRKP